jgi:hypothetical protein
VASHNNDTGRRQFLKSAVLGSVGLATGGICAHSSAAGTQKPVALVEGGKSTYGICISGAASPSEKRAAAEMQKFVEEMSGARLPIVTDAANPEGNLVLVGSSNWLEKLKIVVPFETLGDEGFVLRTEGKHIIIAGGRQRGTMYGVYAFLEKLGCRWYAPDCSVVPKKQILTVARWMKPRSLPSSIASHSLPKLLIRTGPPATKRTGTLQNSIRRPAASLSIFPSFTPPMKSCHPQNTSKNTPSITPWSMASGEVNKPSSA